MLNPLDHPICFATPDRDCVSAWREHVPFAMFLVDALKPRVLVELGTHYGYSYCGFCQAVKSLGTGTKCFAVDTWQGDPHAGEYGPEVYADLRKHHDPLYSGFSTLVRTTFDDASHQFPDGSVDLLHIDGFHSYEAVRHDYETWRPKLSDRAVVIFHDTNVRERNFGVWKFWEEIRGQHPSFEFFHGHGLGVLVVGEPQSEPIRVLLESSQQEATRFRTFFSELGHHLTVEHDKRRLARSRRRFKSLYATQVLETSRILEGVTERDLKIEAMAADRAIHQQSIDTLEATVVECGQVIDDKERQINKARVAIEAKDREIGIKDRAIEVNRRAQIAFEAEIAAKDQEIQDRDQELADAREYIEAREREFAGRGQELESKDMEIEARDLAIAAKNRAIAAKELAVDDKRQTIGSLSAQLDERNRAVEALSHRIAEKDQTIHSLTDELQAIQGGMAWKAARAIQKVRVATAPQGTRRWRAARLMMRGAVIWKREGISTFLGRGTKKSFKIAGRMVGIRPRPVPAPAAPAEAPAPIPVARPPFVYQHPPETPIYQAWLANNRWNEHSLAMAEHSLRNLPRYPRFSIVMPVYNIEDCWLEKAVASVQAQVYPNWELCIADDASTRPNVRPLLHRLANTDPRIKVRYLETNGNISVSSNAAASLAKGEYIVLLDQDDELTPDCLLELALAIVRDPQPDVIYSDDDKMDERSQRFAPQFKPDWSPELLLSYMYFCHVFCFRRDLFEEVGGFRVGFEGCQDYDLALRLTEKTEHIAHIPKVLYHWRALPTSTASSGAAKPEAFQRGVRAVQDALDRRKIAGWASRPEFAEKNHLGLFQVDFADDGPSVAIVIPTKNKLELLRTCVQSILAKTSYRNYEIVVIDNESDDPATLAYLAGLPENCRVVPIASVDGKFSYARINNLAVEQLDHDYILFLNNDTEVRRPEWLSQLVGYAQIPGVGAVGARLLFPDGRIQHAGVITAVHEGMPMHAFKLMPWWDGGYQAYTMVSRNYSAVTAACLLTSRELFLSIGGFDEEKFAVAYNDVDLCLRIREEGLRCVYAPRAELTHYENASRGNRDNPREPMTYKQTWGGARDPYYNPNLTVEGEQFGIRTRRVTAQVAPSRMPIRALFCSHNLNLEGAPLYIYRLLLALKARGRVIPEVHSPCDGPLAGLYREAGITVHQFDFFVHDPNPARAHAETIRTFGEWMVEQDFDVVQGNTLNSFMAINAADEAGLPSLWTVHESADYHRYFENLCPEFIEPALRAFTQPYQVIFVAHATRAMFKPLETEHNFNVIHQGLLRDKIEAFVEECSKEQARVLIGCPPDKLVVSIIGTVTERKGQQIFARAALELLETGRRDVVFYIVGARPSPYQHELELMAQGFEAEIRIVEETPDVHLYYRASDIFVCCSNNESYPTVILEAMAYKLAIVTTVVFGIAEQVVDESSALTFNVGDHARLAQHLARLLDSPSERERLSEAAHCVLNTILSHREMVEQYEEILMEAFVTGGQELATPLALERRDVA